MGSGLGKHSSGGSRSSPYSLGRQRRPDSTDDNANAFTKEYSQYWMSSSTRSKTSTSSFSPTRRSSNLQNDFWTADRAEPSHKTSNTPNVFISPFSQKGGSSGACRSSSAVCPDSPLLLATGQALKREPPRSYVPVSRKAF